MKMTYKNAFILELETGLIDGWYRGVVQDELEEIRDRWDEKRPEYSHILAFTDDNGVLTPKDRYLNANSPR